MKPRTPPELLNTLSSHKTNSTDTDAQEYLATRGCEVERNTYHWSNAHTGRYVGEEQVNWKAKTQCGCSVFSSSGAFLGFQSQRYPDLFIEAAVRVPPSRTSTAWPTEVSFFLLLAE